MDIHQVVYFEDAQLERAVRRAAGVSYNEELTIYDVQYIRELDASGLGIESLEGLQYLTGVYTLNLDDNNIKDLSPLKDLRTVEKLFLYNNFNLSDLTPIQQLVYIEELGIKNTKISDISALSQMKKLRLLNLDGNQISDLSPLSQLYSLDEVSMSSNQISDLSPLSDLSLKYAYFDHNQISDITPLAGMTNFSKLYLNDNQISDITPLNEFAKLKEVSLRGNQISDFSALMNKIGITFLTLEDNPVSSVALSPILNTLTSLYSLSLSVDEVIDLSILPSLNYLTLVFNGATDLSGFTTLGAGDLTVRGFSQDALNTLKDSMFSRLTIEHSEVTDFAFTDTLPQLTFIDLVDSQLNDLRPLQHLVKNFIYFDLSKQVRSHQFDLIEGVAENPFIGIEGEYLNDLVLPDGVSLSEDASLLIFDTPTVGDTYNLKALCDISSSDSRSNGYVELTAMVTIASNRTLAGNVLVNLKSLSAHQTEIQLEVVNTAFEVESITLPNGEVVLGHEATYVVTKTGDYVFTYRDVEGHEFDKVVSVTMKKAPNLIADDVKLPMGTAFDPLKYVQAYDELDGDLEVEILFNDVDITKPGIYRVVYQTTNSHGLSVTKEIQVEIFESETEKPTNQAPTLVAKDLTLIVGDTFNPLNYVRAYDVEDGDLEVEVVENAVDTSKAGVYSVTYRATDSEGLSSTKTIKVTVLEEESEAEKPEVEKPITPTPESSKPGDSKPEDSKPETDKEIVNAGFGGLALMGTGVLSSLAGFEWLRRLNRRK